MHRVRKRGARNFYLSVKLWAILAPACPWACELLPGFWESLGDSGTLTQGCVIPVPAASSDSLLQPWRAALTQPKWPWLVIRGFSSSHHLHVGIQESERFLGFVGREELHSLHWAVPQLRSEKWYSSGVQMDLLFLFLHQASSFSQADSQTGTGCHPGKFELSPLRAGKKIKGSAGNQYMDFSRQLLGSFPYVTCTIWVFPDKEQHNGIWKNCRLEVMSGSP